MGRIAIYGAGGFGKETRMLLDIIAFKIRGLTFAGFIDDFSPREPLAVKGNYDDVSIAIADSNIRETIYRKLGNNHYPFTPLIHPEVYIDKSNHIGNGAIICGGVHLTVDIQLGKCVIINLSSTIGHDVTIGDFTSIMPSVNISGGVSVGKNVLVGSGATILQGLTIGDNAIIGAGAVITRSVLPGKTVIGVPAHEMKGQ